MFPQFALFKQAIVAANLLWMPSSSPTNLSPPVPAPVRAAVQYDARPAARPVSDRPSRGPAPAGDELKCDCRGLPSYTAGLTEAQIRAMD